jgi:hypothetical protein
MPEKTSAVSGIVLATSYAPTAVVGGTDQTNDVNGVLWGWLYVGDYTELAVDVAVTFVGGASPAVTVNIDRAAGPEIPGVNPPLGSNVANVVQTGNGTAKMSIGAGQAVAVSFGRYIRFTWTAITGAPTSVAFVVSIIGKA